uniref:uncharacterized protein LOC122591468 n=1 Tax=Erigeron canadensis TaxID=72917 RepID=UPI001CB899F2|nr:uncharacterized protein LOC122591468 [Erigeron canadensis]
MELRKLIGIVEILKHLIKILPRNGTRMAVVTGVYIIVFPLFFVSNLSTIKPILTDLVSKALVLPSLDPQSLVFAQILVFVQKDVKNFLSLELVFFLALILTSLFTQNAVILLTGSSYNDKKISQEDLMLRAPHSLFRLFVTSFHVTLLKIGFLFFGFVTLMVSTAMLSEYKFVSKVIFWLLVILFVSLYLHFSVVWVLSLVVSVLEECLGIEALGKAGRLLKGKKLDGFFFNVLINVLVYPLSHVLSKLTMVKESELFLTSFWLFLVMGCICLIITFALQAYTVLYFACKKNHGEEIELQGSVEYTKIPAVLPVDIP